MLNLKNKVIIIEKTTHKTKVEFWVKRLFGLSVTRINPWFCENNSHHFKGKKVIILEGYLFYRLSFLQSSRDSQNKDCSFMARDYIWNDNFLVKWHFSHILFSPKILFRSHILTFLFKCQTVELLMWLKYSIISGSRHKNLTVSWLQLKK